VSAFADGAASRGFAARVEAGRRRWDVVQRVRERSQGKSRVDIEADLRTEFDSVGIPQTAEQIAGFAQVINGDWLEMLRSAARVAAGGSATARRAGRLRLTGEHWVDIDMSTDAVARTTVRDYQLAHDVFESLRPAGLHGNIVSARLAMISADGETRVGVFLGPRFVGSLPKVASDALAPTIIEADSRDDKVTVSARIDMIGDLCRVAVALP